MVRCVRDDDTPAEQAITLTVELSGSGSGNEFRGSPAADRSADVILDSGWNFDYSGYDGNTYHLRLTVSGGSVTLLAAHW